MHQPAATARTSVTKGITDNVPFSIWLVGLLNFEIRYFFLMASPQRLMYSTLIPRIDFFLSSISRKANVLCCCVVSLRVCGAWPVAHWSFFELE